MSRIKILVTGATGFVGNHVIQELLTHDEIEIIASSRSAERAKTFDWFDSVVYVPWNIGDALPKNLNTYFQHPDQCIHLAWDGLPDFRTEAHTTDFFLNHRDFLKALVAGGIQKMSVIGTCLEYGLAEGELSETDHPQPTLAYPIGKNMLREFLEDFQKQHPFEFDWIRLFYMYGDGQNPKSILAQLEQSLAENQPTFNMSGGQQIRDYLPVKKVAEVITNLALLKKGNGTINCCSGNPITIQKLVEDFIATKQAQIELRLGFYPYPDYEPFQFWGSTAKLKQLLEN